MKKRGLGWVLGLWLGGCGAGVQPSYLVRTENVPEVRALPPDPGEEVLPSGVVMNEDWVEPLEAGSCLNPAGQPVAGSSRPCPGRGGILVGETRAARDGMYRIRYRELRTLYDADRRVWEAQRGLYEGQLVRADERIRSLQPNWLERNGFPLGVVTGVLVGAILVTGIVAMEQALVP